ncbi:MAG: RNA methyltransferase [Flavobacteriaceae bacterium]|jgi:TrmH family RNA methyltransferase|nr:RNA methyltransferase [Flavobacteriaceae bacterium]
MVSKNQIKFITSLQQKKFRLQHRMFFAEGEKVITEFMDSDLEPVEIFTLTPDIYKKYGAKVTQISESDLKKISTLVTPNNSLGVFKIPKENNFLEKGLAVVLDDVRDPGNLGTIIRLCDWFGIEKIVCSTDSVDVYNPKVVQATMGSLSRVEVYYMNIQELLSETKLAVYGAFMDGENIYHKKLKSEGYIVMGNESKGISAEVEKLITDKITIPRFGRLQQTESLNVATATAIVLSEFRRN